MILRSLRICSLLALVTGPVLVFAQTDTSAKEDERMAALSREPDGWYTPKTKVSVGIRVLSSGARVDFKNLGSIASVYTIVPGTEGLKNRIYTDGGVAVDSPRSTELDANGVQTSTPGGRYQATMPDANGNPIPAGDYLSYTPGLTRQWQAADDSQLARDGYVAFNIYSTTSEGGSTSRKQGATGGLELQVSRDIGRGTRHFQFALLAGISLTDIGGKASGTVTSTLNTYTDYYSLNGKTVPTDQLSNPSTPTDETTGLPVENTVPLSAIPDSTISGYRPPIAGGAQVTGRWQVKGAYFLVKLGPAVRTQLTEHLGLTASAGFAGGYAGTRYTASESFSVDTVPDKLIELTDMTTGATVIGSTTTQFLAGYFADLNLEWSLNETMGLFSGVTAQQLNDYEQKLGDRVAKIDFGSAVGIRGGVSIRF
ncbi:MAG TPA: hypothetical protein VIM71_08955 [Lacunisphaera sp.]